MVLLFAFTNLVIIFGYVFVGVAVVPYMDIRKGTRIWGAIFFLTCALTHLELAVHSYLGISMGFDSRDIDLHMHAVHFAQALSVWGFVSGLYREFVIPRAVK